MPPRPINVLSSYSASSAMFEAGERAWHSAMQNLRRQMQISIDAMFLAHPLHQISFADTVEVSKSVNVMPRVMDDVELDNLE